MGPHTTGPSPAEIARTMASGRLLGVVHLPRHPSRLRVRHATGPDGFPLLLTSTTGELASALRPAFGHADTPMVLSVDDLPPVAGAPCNGRLWMSGWVSALAGEQARAAAIRYAEVNPCSDLLDVNAGYTLYQLQVAEVRLANGPLLTEVDLDDYLAADPDPLHWEEPDLLAELAADNGRRLRRLVGSLAGTDPPPGARAVRLDRFGVVLTVPHRQPSRLRVAFPCPVRDRGELAQLSR